MWNVVLKIFSVMWSILQFVLVPFLAIVVIFASLCGVWYLIIKYKYGMEMPKSGQVRQPKVGLLKQLLVQLPRRYMLDMFNRKPDTFDPKGIHMFCGEQGCGKTIACVEMITKMQNQYPKCKVITNFDFASEDEVLNDWRQLLDYVNGHMGVVVGMDEIQNWFMSGNVKIPPQMLEVATQNRKNHRIICCTAQVFTRVNKALREQVTLVYNPHTFLGCFTVVVKRKPIFDDEGNVIDMKYRGMYSFVHTDELREAYDTYKVIHTLSKEGFKEIPFNNDVNVFVKSS